MSTTYTARMMTEELLEEILEFTSGNTWIKELESKYYNFEYLCNVGGWNTINKYQLAFMCKDYALKHGYILDSQSRGYCRGKGICLVYSDDWTSEFSEHCLESFCDDTEIEAIFRATEWVRNNKKEKK